MLVTSRDPCVTPVGMAGDSELVARLLDGDDAAFATLVDTYHSTMKRVAAGYLGGAPTAVDEVVQETWMAVLKSLDRFEGRSSLKTWIFRILANRAITRAKRERRSVPMSAMGTLEEADQPALDPSLFDGSGMWTTPPVSWGTDPDRALMDGEIRRLVDEAVATLPDRQRTVITLRDLEGWSSTDVRNVLEISETNQRVLLHRARSKVRAALESYYRGRDD